MTHGRIERVRRGISKWLVRAVPLRCLGGRKLPIGLHKLGEGDGAWTVPNAILKRDDICYCFGIGCDASFDLALAEKFSVQVHSFDPTPSSIEYMNCLLKCPVAFHPWGLWNQDTIGSLFHQAVSDDTNLSLINPGNYRGGIQADVQLFRLKTIMQRLGHEKIALIKMDIEGAWYEVIKDMMENGLIPEVLCVEFDSPTSLPKVITTVWRLRKAGLCCIHRHRDDYLFVNQAWLRPSK